jgi:hypothetical protein
VSVLYLITGILALASFVAGPTLAYFELIPPASGFGIFAVGLVLGAAVTLIGIVVIIKGATPMTYAAAAMGLPPAIILVLGLIAGPRYPAINDISTELVYPPEFVHAKTLPANEDEDFTFPEKNKAIIEERYPQLERLAMEGNAEDVFMRASELARRQPGWSVTRSELGAKESVIEGYAATGIFKFKDDWVIRVTNTDNGAVVDMRSRSRDGQGDFGVNAKRIETFFTLLKP